MVDGDGAIGEAAEEVGDRQPRRLPAQGRHRRRRRRVRIECSSAASPRGRRCQGGDADQAPASDVAILNYALTLEYLEAAFYKEAVSGGVVNGDARRFAQDRREARGDARRGPQARRSAAPPSRIAEVRLPGHDDGPDEVHWTTSYALENTGVARLSRPGGRTSSRRRRSSLAAASIRARSRPAAGRSFGQLPQRRNIRRAARSTRASPWSRSSTGRQEDQFIKS